MLLDASDSQLLLIDYQERLMPAIQGVDAVLANAVRLAQAAQALQVPVFATEQYPQGLGGTVSALRPLLGKVVTKMSFSGAEALHSLIRPPVRAPSGSARSLPKHLQKERAAPEAGRSTLVLAGCEAHVCLLQTALELLDDESFEVWVVTDACGSRTERNRDAAFDRLAAAGAELVTTEMVLFEWLRTAEHPRFKDVQGLIK